MAIRIVIGCICMACLELYYFRQLDFTAVFVGLYILAWLGSSIYGESPDRVAVVTPREDLFQKWVEEHTDGKSDYVWVKDETDLDFDRVEPGYCWEVLGNLYFKLRKRCT